MAARPGIPIPGSGGGGGGVPEWAAVSSSRRVVHDLAAGAIWYPVNTASGGSGGSGPFEPAMVLVGRGYLRRRDDAAPSAGQTLHIADAIAGWRGAAGIGGAGTVVLTASRRRSSTIGTSARPAVRRDERFVGRRRFSDVHAQFVRATFQGYGHFAASGNGRLTSRYADAMTGGVYLSDQGTIEFAAANAKPPAGASISQGAQATLLIDWRFPRQPDGGFCPRHDC